MTIIEQISLVRQYMPELLQYMKELLEYKYQSGYADAAELWLPVFNDDDEVVGIERISDNDGSC